MYTICGIILKMVFAMNYPCFDRIIDKSWVKTKMVMKTN